MRMAVVKFAQAAVQVCFPFVFPSDVRANHANQANQYTDLPDLQYIDLQYKVALLKI